jgi:hypothetical protein
MMIMNQATLKGWQTRQLDFVLAYTQADVETDLYMETPKGFQMKGKDQEYVLKLKKNLYGQKQAGRVWNKHLTKRLTENLGFKQSKVDECVFGKNKSMPVIYILMTPFCREVTKASWT